MKLWYNSKGCFKSMFQVQNQYYLLCFGILSILQHQNLVKQCLWMNYANEPLEINNVKLIIAYDGSMHMLSFSTPPTLTPMTDLPCKHTPRVYILQVSQGVMNDTHCSIKSIFFIKALYNQVTMHHNFSSWRVNCSYNASIELHEIDYII